MSTTLEPALAAVIGHPIAHSLSPQLFAFVSKRLGRCVLYKRLDVEPTKLASLFRAVSRTGLFVGWNVTLPHKTAVLKLADRITFEAQLASAANVLCFTSRGVEAHNTDVIGVARTLTELKVDPRKGLNLVYGAGGGARAVACALAQAGAEQVLVCNRTSKRARSLCREMTQSFPRTCFHPVEQRSQVTEPVSLLVNATSAGLPGNPGEWKYPPLAPGALAFDLVYGAKPTPFTRGAAHRGAQTVDGLDMLIWQALASWEIWFGKIEGAPRLKRALTKHLRGGI